jgi:hypothetical protein
VVQGTRNELSTTVESRWPKRKVPTLHHALLLPLLRTKNHYGFTAWGMGHKTTHHTALHDVASSSGCSKLAFASASAFAEPSPAHDLRLATN